MIRDSILAILATGLGAGIGSLVTINAEQHPFWGQRLGHTRFRRAHLPVVGPIWMLGGLVCFLLGSELAGSLCLGFGLGATVQAPLMGLLEPDEPEPWVWPPSEDDA